jgi:staphylococcal nuclease domain-containing protein 1
VAKERRLRIWKDYVAPARPTAASAAEFQGKVVEVISGDFLVVKDAALPPVEHRIALSSIRAPKLGRRDDKDEPFAHEAREFLRSRLIGRKVTVGIDYIRQLPNSTAESERVFASVLEGPNNVAVALVANGLATVMRHRQDDQDRSLYYDDLIQAEAAASRDKKGVHSGTAPPARHINDVSTAAASAQAKQMFPFLQRAGRVQGVVQHVVNGARVKVLIPKHSCIVSLAVAGIRCPATGRKDGEPGEPYGEEAYQFTRDKCLQHDVEVDVSAQDRVGTMIGRLYLHKRDYACVLLHEGYARMSGRDATNEMEEAQGVAQAKRLRTWEKWDAEVEAAKAAEAANEVIENSAGEAAPVTISEMVSATEFFVHAAGSAKQLEYVAERLAAMPLDSTQGGWVPKNGEVCAAVFSADGAHYRARVEGRKGDVFSVTFVDFGNGEDVPKDKMRPLPASVPTLAQVPAQALDYKLAFVKVPREAEAQREAAAFVQELLGATGGVVGAKVEYKERSGRHHVSIIDQESGDSLAAALLRAGLAKLEKRRADMEGLKDEQAAARRAHLGIWRYGDAVDSDEDDARFAQDVAKANAARKR